VSRQRRSRPGRRCGAALSGPAAAGSPVAASAGAGPLGSAAVSGRVRNVAAFLQVVTVCSDRTSYRGRRGSRVSKASGPAAGSPAASGVPAPAPDRLTPLPGADGADGASGIALAQAGICPSSRRDAGPAPAPGGAGIAAGGARTPFGPTWDPLAAGRRQGRCLLGVRAPPGSHLPGRAAPHRRANRVRCRGRWTWLPAAAAGYAEDSGRTSHGGPGRTYSPTTASCQHPFDLR
ncbi:MAG: hypothetical protein QOI83_2255, partial [Streptomycetaceae bacterium]|nr:hypothetical protein [Streptomycetaceae bacterium]